MLVRIKGQVVNQRIITVMLRPEVSDDDIPVVRMLHCVNCGQGVTQIHGRIEYIIDGAYHEAAGQISRCRRCKTNYRTQSL